MHTQRDFNQEYKDSQLRKYAYDFDTVLRQYMMRTFQPLLAQGKALEMGCYKGEMTEMFAQHYDDLTVIEASDELVQIAQGRVGNKVKFLTSMFESATVAAETFDAIFLIHTLEHLDNPVEVLSLAKSWLTTKGRLFIAVPNANAPSRQIAVKMGLITHNAAITEGERKHGHTVTYSLDTLERDASAAGLNIIQRGGVFFKSLANYQFDRLMGTDILSDGYLEGCYKLGQVYPDLCASIYLVCTK